MSSSPNRAEMDSPGSHGSVPSDLPASQESRPPPVYTAVLRTLLWIVLAVITAELLGWLLLAAGAVLPALASKLINSFSTVALVVAAVFLLVLRPLLSQLTGLAQRVASLKCLNAELEERLTARDADLAATGSRLDAERVLWQNAEEEVRRRAEELKGLAERIASLEAALVQRETELAHGVEAAAILRASEKRHRHLLEITPQGIWAISPEGTIEFANGRAAQLLGYDVAEMVGATPERFIVTEDLPAEVQQFHPQPGPVPDRVEFRIRHKMGRELWMQASLAPFPADDGQFGAIMAFADCTDRKRHEARRLLERRLETAGTLASGMAHELNNTLAPILLSAQMLRGKRLEGEDEGLVQTIERSAERSAELLKQALIFARGIEGARVLIEPARWLREMADIAREMLPRNIQVHCQFPSDLWKIKGDPVQLQQALLKLCVNARDAMPSGGNLWLRARNLQVDAASVSPDSLRSPGSYLVMELEDSGCGIPAAVRDRIFEPFFSTRERARSAGLGLSIVFGIVRSHGGDIELTGSQTGATFQIFLPAVTGEADPSLTAKPAAAGRGELILMVEDDAELRDVTVRTLTRNGYEVLAVGDGLEALGLLAQHQGRIRLVLTNLSVPSLDGPALARAARKIDSRIRLMASSALVGTVGQTEKLAALQTLGISRLLSKPYTAEELIRAVRDELCAS